MAESSEEAAALVGTTVTLVVAAETAGVSTEATLALVETTAEATTTTGTSHRHLRMVGGLGLGYNLGLLLRRGSTVLLLGDLVPTVRLGLELALSNVVLLRLYTSRVVLSALMRRNV